MKYTKGPWKILANPSILEVDIVAEKGQFKETGIAALVDGRFANTKEGTVALHIDEVMANARLIASAPELLEVLKKIANMMHPNQSQLIINMRNVAGQAIAKAEGK